MSSSGPIAAPRPVLAEALAPALAPSMPLVRSAAAVTGAALLTAASAQVAIPLGFSPVPITGTTFAVLLTAAALGPLRGVAAQVLYLSLALVGLPFFQDGQSGVEYALGATGGYLAGFVVAAAVVGACARKGLDRRPAGTAVAFVGGSLVVYALGVPWLAYVVDVPAAEALRIGVLPFLVGDAVKAALAAGLLPGAWKLVQRLTRVTPGG